MDELQLSLPPERRRDTVAVSRSTVKAITWVASIIILGVAGFIWDSADAVDDLDASIQVLVVRVQHLEDFAEKGGRYTEQRGEKLERRVERMETMCSRHRDKPAHREQAELNRQIFQRIERLEIPNSDKWNHE